MDCLITSHYFIDEDDNRQKGVSYSLQWACLMCSIPVNVDGFPNGLLHHDDLFLHTSFIVTSDWSLGRNEEDPSRYGDRGNCDLLQFRLCGFASLLRGDNEGFSRSRICWWLAWDRSYYRPARVCLEPNTIRHHYSYQVYVDSLRGGNRLLLQLKPWSIPSRGLAHYRDFFRCRGGRFHNQFCTIRELW